MRLAIIGSRGFCSLEDYALLCSVIDPYKDTISLIVSGGATGADSLGEQYATMNNIKTLIFPADWKKYGKRAGFIRNEDIIKNCDGCIAFWDGSSSGTNHSLSLCKQYDKLLKVIKYNE